MADNDLRYCQHEGQSSWWEYDAQGIELCKVCDLCQEAKLAQYRPEILTGYNQSDVDEEIEPDDWDRGVSNRDFGPDGML